MKLPTTKITLPKLPYNFNALEPVISHEAMEMHYLGNHKNYVDTYNKLLLEEGKQEDKKFNYFGHLLHSILWTCLTPNSILNKKIKSIISEKYLTVDYFYEVLIERIMSIKGSGWLLLDENFNFLTIPNHDLTNVKDSPILVIDSWEHFWVLDDKNRKKDFFLKLIYLINWDTVLERLNYYYCTQ